MPSYRARAADDFAHAFMAKLPRGRVWPREPSSALYRTVRGLAGIVASWAQRVEQFLNVEAFPPASIALLPDWERVLGLPEPCLAPDDTVPARQAAVGEKLARRPGGAARAYFVDVAARLGYAIEITEFRPWACAIGQCGAPVNDGVGPATLAGTAPPAQIGSQGARFYWRVTITGPRLGWFQCGPGGGRCASDPLCRISRAEDLECLLRRLAPLHTELIFSYTGV